MKKGSFRAYSDQQGGWAFTSLESIHSKFENDILDFKAGFNRMKIKIPSEIIPEIKQISQPKDIDGHPSFVFDFLACKVRDGDDISGIMSKPTDNFRWVEVKSEGGKISHNQLNTIENIKMPFTLVVVHNVRETPDDVYLKFYYDEIPQWMIR